MAKESKKSEKKWWRQYTKEYLKEIEKEQEKPAEVVVKEENKPEIRESKLQYIDPFEQMDRMMKEMDESFKDIFKIGFRFPEIPKMMKMDEGTFKRPRINIQTTDKEILITIELPRVKKEDINIKVEGRNLIIDAQTKQEEKKEEEGRAEFSSQYQGYRHVIRLPTAVDKDKAKAHFEKDILVVALPKKESDESPSDIELE